jgi:hypothetical protein
MDGGPRLARGDVYPITQAGFAYEPAESLSMRFSITPCHEKEGEESLSS